MPRSDPLAAARAGALVDGRFVFACASCGGTAATLLAAREPGVVDSGRRLDGDPLVWRAPGPHFVRDFLGITVGPVPRALGHLLFNAEWIDPLDLYAVDRDQGTFCCRECRANYCSNCWSTWMEFDGPFYDYTQGRCPRGHEQLLDD